MMDTDTVGIRNERLDGQTIPPYKGRLVISSSELTGCEFPDFRPRNLTVLNSTLIDCSFSNAVIKGLASDDSSFIGCSFSGLMKSWFPSSVEFIGCRFEGRLQHTVFKFPSQPGGRFEDNDFSKTVFSDVDFRGGIDLDRQILPADDKHIVVHTTEQAVQQALDLAIQRQDERRVIGCIEFVLPIVQNGQKTVIFERDTLPAELVAVLDQRAD